MATLAVFGGSGRTGRLVIDQALEAGHAVQDEPCTGTYRVGRVGVDPSTTVGRADLAGFLLRQVDHRSFTHQLPLVSD